MATTPIVNSTAVINGVDHETFGDNETGSASRASERLFQGPDQPGAAVPGVQVGRRVPRRPVRQRKAPGRRHAGSQRGGTAFEGTSKSTDDLDGRIDYGFFVPKGKTVSDTRR